MRTVSLENWVTKPVMYGAPSGHPGGMAEAPLLCDPSALRTRLDSPVEHAAATSTKVIAAERPARHQPVVGPQRLLDAIRLGAAVIVLRSSRAIVRGACAPRKDSRRWRCRMQLSRRADDRRRRGGATLPPAWHPPGEYLRLRRCDPPIGDECVRGAMQRVGARARGRQYDLYTGRPPRGEEHQCLARGVRIACGPVARVGCVLELVRRRKVVVTGSLQVQGWHEAAESEAEALGGFAC